ncbi:subtilisin-like protease SBT1.1 [Benincasa hispida]|uniref:subtilisin-like protease SBT1.1 n=1 Tax=Benincasa hispida TaxID=102211 RepID=UPI00190175A8|nr:subtilisin-like protease SBT1.1 [Benincasa hispida]XP_038891851.1 subtilisin-like protease SBT1.1 [Benincasa hispida]XP_038891852.1 subtilisin-like protease SBT1.1 [Benincasa hispida]
MKIRQMLMFLSITIAILATSSAAVDQQSYIIHMDTSKMATANNPEQWYTVMIDSVNELASLDNDNNEEEASTAAEILYVYKTAISGFAAKLSTKHLHSLSKIPGFLAATPNKLLQLHTTHSPQFLGLKRGRGLWNSSNLASDIIIGLLDTGIWPEHISFQDKGLSPVPTKWKGICQAGPKFSPSNCNKKLIGARAFIQGYEAVVGRLNETGTFRSPRDSDGHGTHTASTAAGNFVNRASFYNQALGAATGMRFTSRIAAYKVCWPEGCASADILAAMDHAIADGVDVLSISLGGGSGIFYSDEIAIAAFGAIQQGVFVSCSAGNSGPYISTVGNVAPWIMTVAASYTDRTFPTTVKLGNGKVFEGSSLYFGKNINEIPLVYNNTAGDGEESNVCTAGSLVPSMVKGKIVVCERGTNSRTAKGEQVKLAGGAGMILINTQLEGEELIADSHVLPATAVGASASKAIIDYIASSKHQAKASITFKGTKYGSQAPRVAAFSSRGPSFFKPYVIKPDITAPGVNILAAWPPIVSPSELESDKRRVLFNIISGTSMSCPHVSGLAALLKSAHKDWSPAAIKSALMTTAYVTDNKNHLISDVSRASGGPADPYAFGSGHVDPEKASNPGLVYDIAPQDYINYLCSLKYNSAQIALVSRGKFTCSSKRKFLQPGDLNYPSFSLFMKKKAKNVTITFKRTVTNVGIPRSDYTAKINNPEGIRVIVKPEKLSFVRLGGKLSYKVSFVALGKRETLDDFSFGSLVWQSGKYAVRSPIAVTWQ